MKKAARWAAFFAMSQLRCGDRSVRRPLPPPPGEVSAEQTERVLRGRALYVVGVPLSHLR